MRIYLGDLCYLHDWDNNQPLPLNVAYIASYLKKFMPDVEIEIFKDPKEIMNKIREAPPDVLALSHYDWNINLDVAILKNLKKDHPETITVMGGPSFEPTNSEWQKEFFEKRPELDVYITGEGEWNFTRLIELLIQYKTPDKIPFEKLPASFYLFDKIEKKVVNNFTNFVERMDLSTIPSPYLSGMMDKFLSDKRLAPIIETNRGCPYACTFCCWGQATQAKVNQFPLETVLDEIKYNANHSTNPNGFFYIADGNFGIFKRDLQIAETMQKCTNELDFPKQTFIYFAKNTTKEVIKIASLLSGVTSMSMSKQTLNDDVLENIKRKNIPTKQYDVLRKDCEKNGIDTFCELIYALPGETFQSFVEGVKETVKVRQVPVLYPYIMIAGAESSEKEYREKFKIKTRFRIIPRYVSSYDDIASLEYEEIVVASINFTMEDFLKVRLFQFLIYIFKSETFSEFVRGLWLYNKDYATVAELILSDRKNLPLKFQKILNEFSQSANDELLTKDQIKTEFSKQDIENVNQYKIALNPHYMSIITTSDEIMSEFKEYLVQSMDRLFGDDLKENEIEELKTTINFSFDKLIGYESIIPEKIISYNYDVDKWLVTEEIYPLSTFLLNEPKEYKFSIDKDILPEIESLKKFTNNPSEIVYRLRTNLLGKRGDKIFCYNRREASIINQETKQNKQKLSELAVRD